jgi:hypothetical protein
MTEEEWMTCAETWPMLTYLADKGSDRKLRLLACLCCLRIKHIIPTDQSIKCVEVAALYADREARYDDLDESIRALMAACELLPGPRTELESIAINAVSRVHRSAGGGRNASFGLAASAWALSESQRTRRAGESAEGMSRRRQKLFREEFARQAELFREVFGNPFRTVSFSAEWRTSDVLLLAQGIYAERAFDRMPILADALQDAGCDNTDLLGHLRDANATHVRGCWALDLVLGKE